MLRFEELREANVKRCEQVFHPLSAWTPTDWACAMAGEAGETCNAVKKLKRIAEGTNTAKDPQNEAEAIEAIAAELADTIIYADLLAARLGINLGNAVRDKFNEVSRRMSATVTLPEPQNLEGTVSRFIRARCQLVSGEVTLLKHAYVAYQAFCLENGSPSTSSMKLFAKSMVEALPEVKQTVLGGRACWIGIRI